MCPEVLTYDWTKNGGQVKIICASLSGSCLDHDLEHESIGPHRRRKQPTPLDRKLKVHPLFPLELKFSFQPIDEADDIGVKRI